MRADGGTKSNAIYAIQFAQPHILIAVLAISIGWVKSQLDWITPREEAIAQAKKLYIGMDYGIPHVRWYTKLLGCKSSVVIFHVKADKGDSIWEPKYRQFIQKLKRLFPEAIVLPPPSFDGTRLVPL